MKREILPRKRDYIIEHYIRNEEHIVRDITLDRAFHSFCIEYYKDMTVIDGYNHYEDYKLFSVTRRDIRDRWMVWK